MSDMRQMTAKGRRIEDGSFAIIDQEAGAHDFGPREWQVVRRVIHATADFEFKQLMRLSPDAIASGIAALRGGCPIVVDVKMIIAGLNEDRLNAYRCETHCFISDDDVIAEAKSANSTRAIEAMRKAHRLGLLDGAVIAAWQLASLRFIAPRSLQTELVILSDKLRFCPSQGLTIYTAPLRCRRRSAHWGPTQSQTRPRS